MPHFVFPSSPFLNRARWAGQGLFLSAVLLCATGCRTSSLSAGLEPQSEDYSTARSHFTTQLVKHGPAPQQYEPLVCPTGAEQVVYAPELHLQAWITAPPAYGNSAAAKRPAVLFLHGGFALGASDWTMTQPYQDAGYIVMTPAWRGENGQNGEFSSFYNEVSDVIAAADFLAKQPGVDATHIYLAGHSAGGTLTLLAAMTSSRFRAAASFSGAPDVIAFTKQEAAWTAFDPSNVREGQMRSAAAFASSFKCPARLYYGTQELFFAAASKETSERAKAKGLDVDSISVVGDHFSAVPEEIRDSILFFQAR